MSGWIVADNRAAHEVVVRLLRESGMPTRYSDPLGARFVCAWGKQAVHVKNWAVFDGHTVVDAGTLIRVGSLGSEALAASLEDVCDLSVDHARSRSLGHDADRIFWEGGDLFAVSDRNGGQPVCTDTNERATVQMSTRLGFLARTGPTLAVTLEVLLAGHVGPKTLFARLRGPVGTDALISGGAGDNRLLLERVVVRRSCSNLGGCIDTEEAVTSSTDEVVSGFSHADGIAPIRLEISGWHSSRTVLLSVPAAGRESLSLAAQVASRLADANPRDAAIVAEAASGLGLNWRTMSRLGIRPHDVAYLEGCWRRHQLRGSFRWSQGLLDDLEDGLAQHPCLFLGGYSPASTQGRPWVSSGVGSSLESLGERRLTWLGRRTPQWDQRVQKHTRGYIEQRIDAQALPDAAAVQQDRAALVRALLLLARPGQDANGEFQNRLSHYVAPSARQQLWHPLLAVPPRIRQGYTVPMRLIQHLRATLLDTRIGSGHRENRPGEERMTLAHSMAQPSLQRNVTAAYPGHFRRAIRRSAPRACRRWHGFVVEGDQPLRIPATTAHRPYPPQSGVARDADEGPPSCLRQLMLASQSAHWAVGQWTPAYA